MKVICAVAERGWGNWPGAAGQSLAAKPLPVSCIQPITGPVPWGMPRWAGTDCCRLLKGLETCKSVPIIASDSKAKQTTLRDSLMAHRGIE